MEDLVGVWRTLGILVGLLAGAEFPGGGDRTQ